jgi:hypothetical protein
MATSSVVLPRSRAEALVATQTSNDRVRAPNDHRTLEVRPVQEKGDGGAVAWDLTTATISNARSLRALPLGLLRTSRWVNRLPVRLDNEETRTLLNTLRANSEDASTRLADNVLAHLVTARGSWSPHHPQDVVAAVSRSSSTTMGSRLPVPGRTWPSSVRCCGSRSCRGLSRRCTRPAAARGAQRGRLLTTARLG